jgi:IS1 family transposase
MANVLPREKRIAVLRALVNGNSERSAAEMSDVNARTVARLNVEFGTGAARFHDKIARELTCTEIECDEIWAFVRKKQARVKPEDPREFGEAYTYVGLDRASRFVIAFHVAKRNQEGADRFMADLRARLVVMPDLSTDGFAAYPSAVGEEFGRSVNYSTMTKNYRSGGRRDDDHRYEPPRGIEFITKKTVYGSPDHDRTSTAHVERNNLTMRHHIGRIRRLCLAFSKRFDHHCHAVALGYVWYNVGCIVKGLRMSPAMAVGALDTLMTIEEFHDVITEMASEPIAKPVKQPLQHRTPPGTVRELPNGRGFLRALPGGGAPSPGPSPEPTPAAPAAPALVADENGQYALFSWTPPRREPVQLDLFDR